MRIFYLKFNLMNKENPKGPIFIPKGNGLGWTLNFKRPVGFVILGGVIVGIVLIELCVTGVIKL
jgi:uncharacterized membrane protein